MARHADPSEAAHNNKDAYLIAILAGALALAYVDRQILVVLIESIKTDLSLSDTQIGVVTGAAFTIVYAIFGVPIARLADKSSRRNIIVIAISVWSVMTAVCGLAHTFWQLMLARIGVGVGEAGCIPPSHSLISATIPAPKLGLAMGFYGMGVPLGAFVGMFLGGWLGELVGWRWAFVCVGVPGLLYALIVRFTIHEPVRVITGPQSTSGASSQSLAAAIRRILSDRVLLLLLTGSGFSAIGMGGILIWAPSLLLRSSEMTPGIVGTWLGLIIGIGGAVGGLLGGVIADVMGRKDIRWRFILPAMACLLACLFVMLVLHGDAWIMLVLLAPTVFFGFFPTSGIAALVQSLSPVPDRSLASSLLSFFNTMLGLALGPFIIGVVSDALHPVVGVDSLRLSLLILLPISFGVASLCYFIVCFHKGIQGVPTMKASIT